jgi:predicted transposase/invertase (TIGR01784 family)
MRRDTIFYKLFKQFPGLLFELVDEPPPEAENYQFESVEVKETAFRIDGVFLPPPNAVSKTIFFAEVQFQKDEDLYHRFFSELFLFLYRNSIRYDDWFGVIIFASGSLEPSNSNIHRALLESGQIKRVYLDELGDLREQPLGLGLMLLTNVTSETEAVEGARFLLEQAQQQSEQAIIDLKVFYLKSRGDCRNVGTELGRTTGYSGSEGGRTRGRQKNDRFTTIKSACRSYS